MKSAPALSSKRSLPSLDGIRGLAVLLVVLCHLCSAKIFRPAGVDLRPLGVIGVYLFFALSAFLLAGPFWSKTPDELFSCSLWGGNLLRRCQRILPLYAIALLILHWLNMPVSNGIKSLPPHRILQWLMMRDGEAQFWSIPVEVKFYLLLPLFILVFAGLWRKSVAAGIVGAICLAAFWKYIVLPFDNYWSLNGGVEVSHCLPVFLLGSVAGSAHSLVCRKEINAKWFAWSCELCAVACLVLVALLSRWSLTDKSGANYCFGILWSLLIFSHLHGVGLTKSLFAWLPLRLLGIISFSTYLSHKAVMNAMRSVPPSPMAPPLAFFAMIVAVGAIGYLVLERPIMRFRLRTSKPKMGEAGGSPENEKSENEGHTAMALS